IDIGTSSQLRLIGGSLSNTGTMSLDRSTVGGTSTLLNSAGGQIVGSGTISAPITNTGGVITADSGVLLITNLAGGNTNGGELRISDTLNILNNFSSDGTIVMGGSAAQLSGGVITNTGTIRGIGRISNRILNSGIVHADPGELTLAASGSTNTT